MSSLSHYSKELLFTTVIVSRRVLYRLLGFVDRTVLKKQNPIVILSYHSVTSDNWRFSVDEKMIKKQIIYLKKHFDIITLKKLSDYMQGKTEITKPSVVLTFDDGYKDILTLKSFFAKHTIQPTLFLLSNTKQPDRKELGNNNSFLTKADIKSLIKAKWEFGCHSATHANLATLSPKALEEEIVMAKKNLEKELGITIPYFAYPRGKYTQQVVRLVKKAKYEMAFTMDDGFIKPTIDIYTLPRVGVDRTHTFSEFVSTFSPSVVRLRQFIKKSPVGRYL